MFRGKCDKCGAEIASASTQAQFNRNAGLHMSAAHGMTSPKDYRDKRERSEYLTSLAVGDHEDEVKRVPKSGTKAYKRNWYRKHKKQLNEARRQMRSSSEPNGSHVEECRLSHCPVCGSRFYVAKGAVNA